MKILFTLFLFLVLNIAHASVWVASKTWDKAAQESWQNWIKSASVQKDFFMKPGPWQGLKLDCADVYYAFRIIFAYENKLPFKIALGASNQSTAFDRYAQGALRVRAFINYVSETTNAETLSRDDSYPVKILDIKPGDLYSTEWMVGGRGVRHSHLIKNVIPYGYFHILFGTTPAENRNLGEILGMPLTNITGSPWGFKRFKTPQDYIRKPLDQSDEQYEILKEVGTDGFFERIHEIIKQMEEPIGARIDRQVKNLCSYMASRADLVTEAQNYLKKVQNRCLNTREVEAYSTTVRDARLISGIEMLRRDWLKLTTEGGFHEASLSYQIAADYLIDNDRSEYAHEQLLNLCTVSYANKKMDLKTFFDRYQAQKISSHPNDSVDVRWGEDGNQTNCKATSF